MCLYFLVFTLVYASFASVCVCIPAVCVLFWGCVCPVCWSRLVDWLLLEGTDVGKNVSLFGCSVCVFVCVEVIIGVTSHGFKVKLQMDVNNVLLLVWPTVQNDLNCASSVDWIQYDWTLTCEKLASVGFPIIILDQITANKIHLSAHLVFTTQHWKQ